MTVRLILDGKGREVATASPSTSVGEACRMLAQRRIGALLVTGAQGRMTGIVSERDIVKALSEVGAAALDKPVSAIMTREVVTCSEADHVADVMRQMTSGKFRHVPVVDETGGLIGVVSIGDVVKHRLNELEAETHAMRDYIVMA
jgi:CBS domain-containing protein